MIYRIVWDLPSTYPFSCAKTGRYWIGDDIFYNFKITGNITQNMQTSAIMLVYFDSFCHKKEKKTFKFDSLSMVQLPFVSFYSFAKSFKIYGLLKKNNTVKTF